MNQSLENETGHQNADSRSWSWKRILYWTGGTLLSLVVLAYFLVPPTAASYLHSRIVRTVEEQTGGSCKINQLSISWTGSLQINELHISDMDGQPMVSLDHLDGQVNLFSALTGTYEINGTLQKPELVVRRMKDGRLNFASFRSDSQETSNPSENSGSGLDFLSSLRGSINVTEGSIRFIGPNGQDSKMTSISTSLSLNGDRSPSQLTSSVSTPGEPGGTIDLKGSIDFATLRNGSLQVELNRITLKELSPAVALFTRARNLRGELDGTLSVSRSSQLSSNADLHLTEFHMEGTGEPVNLPVLTLTQETSLDATGSGTLSLKLNSGDVLQISMNGTSEDLMSPGGNVQASWTLDSSLSDASEKIPSLLNLKTGWRLDGSLSADGSISASRHTTDTGPDGLRGSFSMQTTGTSVSSISPEGKRISLGEPSSKTELDFDVRSGAFIHSSTDPRLKVDSTDLKTFSAELPGLSANVSGRVRHLLTEPRLEHVTAAAEVDLDTMKTKLSPFGVFGGYDVGGTVNLDLKGSGNDPFRSNGTLTTDQLTVTAPERRPAGPFNLKLSQTSTINYEDRELQVTDGHLTGEQFSVRTNTLRALRPLETGGTVEATGRLLADLSPLTKKLAPFLQPLYKTALNRSDVNHLSGTVNVSQETDPVRVQRRENGLHVAGSASGGVSDLVLVLNDGRKMSLRNHLSTELDGSFDAGSSTTQINNFSLDTGGLTVDVNDTTIQTGKRPYHVNSMNTKLDADLTELKNLIQAYKREGELKADGTLRGTVDVSGTDHLRGRMNADTTLNVENLSLEGLEQGTAGPFTGRLSAPGAVLDLRPEETSRFSDLTLDTEVLNGSGQVELTGLRFGTPSSVSVQLEGTVTDPEKASDRLEPFLAGYRFSGRPIRFQLEGSGSPESFEVTRHTITSESTTVATGTSGERSVTLGNLQSTGSMSFDRTKLTFRDLSLQTDAGSLKANGSVGMPGNNVTSDVDLNSKLQLSLAATKDLLPASYSESKLEGDVKGTLTLGGTMESMTVKGRVNGTDVTYTPPEADGPVLEDQQVSMASDLVLDLASQPRSVTLTSASMDSNFARLNGGEATVRIHDDRLSWSEWTGTLDYHMKNSGAIIGPLLPWDVRFTGDDWKTVRFQLASGSAPAADLPYALNGIGSYELGTVRWKGTDIQGGGDLIMNDQRGTVTYDLKAGDEGTITGKSEFDLRIPDRIPSPSERSHSFAFDVRNVRVREQMATFLQALHPILESIGGTTEGTMDLSYDLTMTGPLTGAEPLERLSGPGWMHARNIDIRPGSFASNVLSLLEEKQRWTADIPRVDMKIDGRRIHHDNFAITLSDHEISTSGWVSTTGAFSLDVRIPVTEKLVRKYEQLKSLKGSHLTLPVTQTEGGTVSVGLQKALRDTLQKSAEERLKEELDKRIKDLFD